MYTLHSKIKSEKLKQMLVKNIQLKSNGAFNGRLIFTVASYAARQWTRPVSNSTQQNSSLYFSEFQVDAFRKCYIL
jgi:hypothetical protein